MIIAIILILAHTMIVLSAFYAIIKVGLYQQKEEDEEK